MLKIKGIIFPLMLLLSQLSTAKTAEAVFAGGNFWRMEAWLNDIDGVLVTVAGFDGGREKNPDYNDMVSGRTHFTEAVRVIYNPDKISYEQLLNHYWKNIDPTASNAQFCDIGPQYRTVIFYLNENQKKIAQASKQHVEKRFPKIVTEISPSTQFYAADGSQQGYYQNHPLLFKYYLYRCGHDERIAELWKQ